MISAGVSHAEPAPQKPGGREPRLSAGASLALEFAPYFELGAAIPGAELSPQEQQLLRQHFHAVTPENCMKPAPIHPEENRFNFARADALVEMARSYGLSIHGHTLVWHHQCPDWFFLDGDRPADRPRVLERLRTHIATVVGHFAGRVKSWDVVNEALDDGDGYFRPSPWLKTIGEDFVAEAFLAAHRADPDALLFYNDYGIERPGKRAKALRLVQDLKRRGVPIHGVGIQGHWQLHHIPFSDIEAAISAFHAEGLEVMITELDLDVVPRTVGGADVAAAQPVAEDPFADGLPSHIQEQLAQQYAALFALFLRHHDQLRRVTFWGLHDGRSWLNSWPRKRTNHPLLWDRSLQPKPALWAVLETARQACRPRPRDLEEGPANPPATD